MGVWFFSLQVFGFFLEKRKKQGAIFSSLGFGWLFHFGCLVFFDESGGFFRFFFEFFEFFPNSDEGCFCLV